MLNIDGIGRLNKRIEFVEYIEKIDEYGLTHQALEKVFPFKIWARIEPLRGKEYLEAYKENLKEFVKITIRYRKGITTDMLIQYGNKLYEINSIQNPYEENVKLEIMCIYKKVGESNE